MPNSIPYQSCDLQQVSSCDTSARCFPPSRSSPMKWESHQDLSHLMAVRIKCVNIPKHLEWCPILNKSLISVYYYLILLKGRLRQNRFKSLAPNHSANVRTSWGAWVAQSVKRPTSARSRSRGSWVRALCRALC